MSADEADKSSQSSSKNESNADCIADEIEQFDFSRAPSLASTDIGDVQLPFYCPKLSNEETEQAKRDALKCFKLFKKTETPKNKNKKETYVHIKVSFVAIEGRKARRKPLNKPECLDCSTRTTNFHYLCDSCNNKQKKKKKKITDAPPQIAQISEFQGTNRVSIATEINKEHLLEQS